ncbi:uncharacterized protein LOC142225105 [Haematobia irritans]|uniref:uncharacterized protein LOC142225105 n=1 Tax=Haematobia irritans TaxID=7368 RepID=UPI003F4FD3B4
MTYKCKFSIDYQHKVVNRQAVKIYLNYHSHKNPYEIMGNYMDKGSHTFEEDEENLRPEEQEGPNETSLQSTHIDQTLSNSTTSIEVAQEAGESIDFHIFSYKQHMPFKTRQVFKWAAAKLALTEELIRTNQIRCNQIKQVSYLEPESDYLSDDEMDDTLDRQLHSLEKYRTELVQLLGRLSLNARSKTKRKKSKKFKRRKLISKCNNKIESDCDYDSEMSDSTKITFNINVNRDKVIKRTPFKVKNC